MFELFTNMVKEEWRIHSTLFGSLSFALFPVMIFCISCMGSFLLPLFTGVLPPGYLAIILHAIFLLLGIMVGGFGLMGMEVMNRRFGQASLLAYSARSLPLSERQIFLTFVIKDIVYYLLLYVLPFVFGFAVASPFIHLPLRVPLLLFVTLTLAFLTGLALIFFLSTVYSRSKRALGVLFACLLVSGAVIYLYSGINPALLFPPLQLFYAFSAGELLIACVLILVPSAIAVVLFSSEYADTTKRFKNTFASLSRRLSFFPHPPLAAKDLLDLIRSGSFTGQVIFSFLIPLGLLWVLLSILGQFLPPGGVLLLLAILTGVIASTIYSWLTMYDTFGTYACLPVSVRTLLSSKMTSFSVLQCIPVAFIVLISIGSGGIAYLVPALALSLSVSFYACAVTVWLTGLAPNVLVYDVKVLLAWLFFVGIVLCVLIVLMFTNPYYAIASVLLLPVAAWLMKVSYRRWDSREQPGF